MSDYPAEVYDLIARRAHSKEDVSALRRTSRTVREAVDPKYLPWKVRRYVYDWSEEAKAKFGNFQVSRIEIMHIIQSLMDENDEPVPFDIEVELYNNIPSGPAIFSIRGVNLATGNYRYGLLDGPWVWRDHGLELKLNYKQGLFDGVQTTHYSGGIIQDVVIEATFKNGLLNGPQRTYENEKLVEEENYKNGVLHGLTSQWNKRGNKREQSTLYVNGVAIGISYKVAGREISLVIRDENGNIVDNLRRNLL